MIVDSSGAALNAFRDEKLWMLKINAQELADLSGADVKDEVAVLLRRGAMTVKEGGAVEQALWW